MKKPQILRRGGQLTRMIDKPNDRIPESVVSKLEQVSCATLTSVLGKLGYGRIFAGGVRPLTTGARLVGQALTLSYLPIREDFWPVPPEQMPSYPQRVAIESIQPGDVLVVDARGNLDAGVLGDILAARVKARGGAGIVVDGAVRDSPAIREIGLPCYSRGVHASASMSELLAIDVNRPVQCGGVLVMPGDVVVGDEEGAAFIPLAVAEQAAEQALEQEQLEIWVRQRIEAGGSTSDYYPPTEAALAEYRRWQEESEQRP
jgi:regulator of RNase E activity RraA